MYSNRKKPKMQGKKPSHRNAVIRSQVLELIRAERLKTTPTKGKILKQRFDRLVTEAKKNTPASKRNVESFLRSDKASAKFYNVILPRLQDRSSGYVISARTLPRKGDNAPQMICMVVGHEVKERRSRLAAALERQESKDGGKKRGGLLSRGGSKVTTPDGVRGEKIESKADTRRIST